MMALRGGAQLVAHAGEELRLVLARLRQLPILVLNLVEQAHVFDGNHRLVGEGLNQLDLFGCEWSRRGAGHRQNPNGSALTHERDSK
jgi:hypothetical protein